MFETLPVVIPTLRDVARGTLRPPTPADPHGAALQTATAAILLDAAAPDAAPLSALYDELGLYLQSAGLATLRLHRRERSTLAQTIDILAAVTLLRSQGYQRVILIVAMEGAIPHWERSRAETLAGMLEIVRHDHGGSAAELIGAIENLVATIRGVADGVIGVATILVRPSKPALAPVSSAARVSLASRPYKPGGRRSLMTASRAGSPPTTSSSSLPAVSPKALAISLGAGESTVSAVSQLYLWCRALATQSPEVAFAPMLPADDLPAPEMLERSREVKKGHAAGAEFHATLRWLSDQWMGLIGEMERITPEDATHGLAAMVRRHDASARLRRTDALEVHTRKASCAAWSHLDASTRLKWLELCQQAFENLRVTMPVAAEHVN